ncbi:GlsB/YeaQ/YmgE family stress response membrane protein [Nocardioides xinjiangensis]|uniref:GlsB/YeaQ/YmgE family stress response membrane protein n=1 Tax=Nocardioides xinjiangensis TaxID=2817376 RepID=UPI0027DBE981|nr:hypothetical protein [Nocardioides sp. SYSU D00778]
MGLIWTAIVTILLGLVIGFLGKAVAPGSRDNIPLWLTVVCGILGAVVGNYLYWALFGAADGYRGGDMHDTNRGLDWWRHAWQVGAAAGLVVVAATVTGRRDRAA